MDKEHDFYVLKHSLVLYVESNEATTQKYNQKLKELLKDVKVAKEAMDIHNIYMEKKPDIAIFDIGDGKLNLLKMFREHDKVTPILLISNKKSEMLLYELINLMVDGFLLSSESDTRVEEILLNAVKRLQYHEPLYAYFSSGVVYDFITKEFSKDGKKIILSAKENLLFDVLINKAGKIVSKEEIASKVWIHDYMSESALKNLIASLRKKIGKDSIINKAGLGWQINGIH